MSSDRSRWLAQNAQLLSRPQLSSPFSPLLPQVLPTGRIAPCHFSQNVRTLHRVHPTTRHGMSSSSTGPTTSCASLPASPWSADQPRRQLEHRRDATCGQRARCEAITRWTLAGGGPCHPMVTLASRHHHQWEAPPAQTPDQPTDQHPSRHVAQREESCHLECRGSVRQAQHLLLTSPPMQVGHPPQKVTRRQVHLQRRPLGEHPQQLLSPLVVPLRLAPWRQSLKIQLRRVCGELSLHTTTTHGLFAATPVNEHLPEAPGGRPTDRNTRHVPPRGMPWC
mmetsp:Transcript_60501/g.160862  ORF Transcript_60501/g.160862 Transcript_60501/m.160862 type:complete len:280 (-) Transcript_60501:54-893(-)